MSEPDPRPDPHPDSVPEQTLDPVNERLRPLRDVPPPGGALTLDKLWLWQKLGLVVALLIALLIAALTLTPIPARAPQFDGVDKLYHFAAFGALIFPLILTDSRRWRWAVPLVCLYGGAIELIQPSVGRSAEWLDFGADVSGALAGSALAEILHDRIQAAFFRAPEAPAPDPSEEEARRMEQMRAELMNDLRAVLREELAAIPRPTPEDAGKAPADGQQAPQSRASAPLRAIK